MTSEFSLLVQTHEQPAPLQCHAMCTKAQNCPWLPVPWSTLTWNIWNSLVLCTCLLPPLCFSWLWMRVLLPVVLDHSLLTAIQMGTLTIRFATCFVIALPMEGI